MRRCLPHDGVGNARLVRANVNPPTSVISDPAWRPRTVEFWVHFRFCCSEKNIKEMHVDSAACLAEEGLRNFVFPEPRLPVLFCPFHLTIVDNIEQFTQATVHLLNNPIQSARCAHVAAEPSPLLPHMSTAADTLWSPPSLLLHLSRPEGGTKLSECVRNSVYLLWCHMATCNLRSH